MAIVNTRRNWTRDEVILALGLYFQTPFGKITDRNTRIREIAKFLGRTPAALSMKMCNLGRFDPTLQNRNVSGLTNGAKMDESVWREFDGHAEELSREYARVLTLFGADASDAAAVTPAGAGNGATLDLDFFRQSVLSAYDNTCCITGIDDERLLSAYHFKPLEQCEDANEKMNPRNGISLSGLYGDAFAKGLITIDDSLKVVLSPSLKDHLTRSAYDDFFSRYANTMIRVPDRSRPAPDFIHYHNEHVFAA